MRNGARVRISVPRISGYSSRSLRVPSFISYRHAAKAVLPQLQNDGPNDVDRHIDIPPHP